MGDARWGTRGPAGVHAALLRPGLFEGLGPVAAHEEADFVVRYWLHGFDWSLIAQRGPTIAAQWHSIEPEFGPHRAEEALRNYIQASRHDPDYREALDRIAAWHLKQRRLFPAPLVAWAIQLHLGELPTPPQPVGLEFLIRPPLATEPGPGSEMPTVCC